MNIFIAGATGVLGHRVVRQLRGRGHSVAGLIRSEKGERLLTALGAQPRRADLFDRHALEHAAQGADVIIHAATSIPVGARPRRSDWKMNDRIRREGTEALAHCAGAVGAKLLIFQSIVWAASPPDGSSFDESSPPHPDAIGQSALDGERIAQQMGQQLGFGACILRCSWFYGDDSAHTRMFARQLQRRRMPILGKGDAVWSSLHLDDAASAFVAAAEAGRAGLWHVTDDQPASMAEFLTGLAQRLGAPPPRSIPIWVARLLAGNDTVNFLTQSTRASNARFRRDFSWSPRYPSFREGFDQVIESWGPDGPPPN